MSFGKTTKTAAWLLTASTAPVLAMALGHAPSAQPEVEAEEQKWMVAGTPGEHHAALNQFVGAWDAKASFWMVPGQPPMESVGVMVNTMILGGRWLRQEYKSEMFGAPFEGIGHWGYDNVENRYVATWMDSQSTYMMLMHGTPFDAATQTFTSTGEFKDPSGVTVKQKHVVTVQGPDKHTFTAYNVTDAGDAKMMEFVYTRQPQPTKAGQ